MNKVGEKLQDWAVGSHEENESDAFGRSAFNRYYYAAYLETRDMLSMLDPKWARTSHKDIPQLLKRTVTAVIRKEANTQRKAGLITGGRASGLCSTSNDAASELSNLLESAYDIRVVADYNPDIRVVKNGAKIELANEKLDSARTWKNRASIYTKQILKVWKELGIS